jgi:hypothetical protein
MTESDIQDLPIEGEQGVKSLCKLAKWLGYEDPNHQLQLSTGECIGDLLLMLQDNPCMVEAVIMCVTNNPISYKG